MKIALGVEYDGSRYHGWQKQPHAPSVQAVLEAAVARVAAAPVSVVCAGRTDTGVHAQAQVVHFETAAERPDRAWLLGVNSHLPPDVALRWARHVADDFHARYAATARSYRYVILNRPTRPALLARRVTWVHRPLDAACMHEAAQALRGEHDFSTYRALGCQARHPRRCIESIAVTRDGECLYLDVTANAFLHHMVRNIAGVLIAIGKGERPVTWAGELLALRDRRQGGVTAPPHGLYLVGVRYPARFGLPEPPPPVRYG